MLTKDNFVMYTMYYGKAVELMHYLCDKFLQCILSDNILIYIDQHTLLALSLLTLSLLTLALLTLWRCVLQWCVVEGLNMLHTLLYI